MKNGPPEWNEDRASALVGKYALIGLAFLDEDDNLISQVQRHGRILEMDASRGIAIRLVAHGHHWDGEIYRLPPDLSAFVDAPPGEYRLRSTGEVVVDPDVTASWTIKARRPRRHAREAPSSGSRNTAFGFETGES